MSILALFPSGQHASIDECAARNRHRKITARLESCREAKARDT
jgi:hypothetical protein